MTMAAKRSRFPGTPSIALAKGRGVIAVSEVLVTWVSDRDTHVASIVAARDQALDQVYSVAASCGAAA